MESSKLYTRPVHENTRAESDISTLIRVLLSGYTLSMSTFLDNRHKRVEDHQLSPVAFWDRKLGCHCRKETAIIYDDDGAIITTLRIRYGYQSFIREDISWRRLGLYIARPRTQNSTVIVCQRHTFNP